jgi:tRNA U34 2-thiouridine synthase MnmA/TrmU
MKALALFSGGLDSTVALKLILEQGMKVEAVNFVTPFCQCRKGGCGAAEAAKAFNVPLKVFNAGNEYLKMVRKPKFGYGKNLNPCIDCRIFMLKKAKKYADAIGAAFIFTGEVLDQRPMSQHKRTLDLIEKEAGLEGKILRPLSAKLLPPTEAEEQRFVDRKKLLSISGRSRKKQIELAKQFNIVNYPCPSGGCLLTDRNFAKKLADLFAHKKHVSMKDVYLLKLGRHFRFKKNKIIVGRNEAENQMLLRAKLAYDYCFEVPDCGSPISILQGPKTASAIEKAACLTKYYSDNKAPSVQVNFGKSKLDRRTVVSAPTAAEVTTLRID